MTNSDGMIVVDLTEDEDSVSQSCRNRRLRKSHMRGWRLERVQANDSVPEEASRPTMIETSTSGVLRGNCGSSSSLATALRDRRNACLIPVQPNRSLPLHPAPPMPTGMPTLKSRTDRSSSLQNFTSSTLTLDVVEVENANSYKSPNKFEVLSEENLDRNSWHHQTEANFIQIEVPSDLIENNSKRKNGDEKSNDGSSKKKNKHATDTLETPRTEKHELSNVFIDLGRRIVWHQKVPHVCTEPPAKDRSGKVPPLRLKKIGSKGNRQKKDRKEETVQNCDMEKDSNYRIVTGATPAPQPISEEISIKEENNPGSFDGHRVEDILRRNSHSDHDDHKLKSRQDRLGSKLRELRRKALDLGQQMAEISTSNDVENTTRLKQMMTSYERQIENLSKLLNKLSAVTTTVNETDVVDIEDNDGETVPKASTPSPEPPKLSPTTLVNFCEDSSPRNSPPILPRVSLTIPADLSNLSFSDISSVTEESEKPRILDSFSDIQCTFLDNNSPVLVDLKSPQKATDELVANDDSERITEEKEVIKSTFYVDTLIDKPVASVESIDVDEKVEEKQCSSALNSNKSGIGISDESNSIVDRKEGSPTISSSLVSSMARSYDGQENVISIAEQKKSIWTAEEMLNNESNVEQFYGDTLKTDSKILANSVTKIPKDVCMTNSSIVSENPTSSLLINSSHESPSSPKLRYEQSHTNKNDDTVEESSKKSKALSSPKVKAHRIMSEEFPSLGNWVACMYRKQNAAKSKVKETKTVPSVYVPVAGITTTPISTSISVPRTTSYYTTNAIQDSQVTYQNLPNDWNDPKWQRSQLPQRSTASSMHSSSVASPRQGYCSPATLNQLYTDNYTMDAYRNTSYTLRPQSYPYTFPYTHLIPNAPVTGCHRVLSETPAEARPTVQAYDKRLLQTPEENQRAFAYDSLKYSTSQVPSNNFPQLQSTLNQGYHLRRSNNNSSNANARYLAPIVLPPGQVMPQSPVRQSSSTQYGRRIIPDVVAAAAAAAVVAAASFGRQRPTQSCCSRTTSNGTSYSGNRGEFLGYNQSNNGQLVSSSRIQTDNGNTTDNYRHLPTYHQLNRLPPFVRQDVTYGMANSSVTSSVLSPPASPSSSSPLPFVTVSSATTTTVTTSSSGYNSIATGNKSSSRGTRKRAEKTDVIRDCETPHLGKVVHSTGNQSGLNMKSSYQCFNCGLPGSVFKCLGCEAAYYCGEQCQSQHWKVHVEKCPKQMPKLKKVV